MNFDAVQFGNSLDSIPRPIPIAVAHSLDLIKTCNGISYVHAASRGRFRSLRNAKNLRFIALRSA